MRIGLIGCGKWGQTIRRVLTDLGHDTVVYDPALEESLSSARQLVKISDRTVIATPPQHHADLVGLSLEWQTPFFVEKPLALDPISSATLVFLARQHQIRGMVGHIALHADNYPPDNVSKIGAHRAGNNPAYHDVSAWWDIGVHDVAVAVDKIGRPDTITISQDFDHYQARLESPRGVAELSGTRTSLEKEWTLTFDGWPWTPYDSTTEPLRNELEAWLDGMDNLETGHLVVETLWRGDQCSL